MIDLVHNNQDKLAKFDNCVIFWQYFLSSINLVFSYRVYRFNKIYE